MNAARFPVRASLAADYLPIMASSVSSERAFSAAGITITKRRNRLKHDIVEALQFLKCAIRKELLFRDPPPTSLDESMYDELEDDDNDSDWVDESEAGWDLFLEADDGDEDEMDD